MAKRNLHDFKNDVARMQREIHRLKDDLPRIGGTTAIKFVHDNFRKQSFQGNTTIRWPSRVEGSPRASRKLLRDRNNLFDSIEYKRQGLGFKISVDLNVVPYAKIHNEGGTITVTTQMKKYFWAMHINTGDKFYKHLAMMKAGKVIKIKKRQFIGFSPVLDEMIDKELDFNMDIIFK